MNLFSKITSSYKDPFVDPFSQFKSNVTPQTTTNTGAWTSLNSSVQSSYKLPKWIPTPVFESTMAKQEWTDRFWQNQSDDFMAQDFAWSLFKWIADTATNSKRLFSEWVSNASNFVWYRALWAKVQEKFPWAYDNVDLALLGKKTLEKHPEYQKFVDEQNNTSFFDHPISSTIWAVGKWLTLGGETASTWVEQAATAPQQKDFATASSQFWKWVMNTALWSTQLATSFNPAWLALNTAFSTDTAWKVLHPINDIMWQGIYNIQSGLWYDPNSEASKNVREMWQTTATLWALKVAHSTVNKGIDIATPYVKPLVNSAVEGTVNLAKKIPKPTLIKWSDISTRANRFIAGDEQKFIDQMKETPGEFATSRGMKEVWEKAIERAQQNFERSKAEADTSFEAIQGKFSTKWSSNDIVWDLLKANKDKMDAQPRNKDATRVNELLAKYESKEWLSMTEINEAKRIHARNHKYSYEQRTSNEARNASDIQNDIRDWQFKTAKENWFLNADKVNMETKGWKMFADSLAKKMDRSGANNSIGITDWIALSGGNPTNVALFLGKKVASSNLIKTGAIKLFSKQTKPSIIEWTKADIQRANIEKKC